MSQHGHQPASPAALDRPNIHTTESLSPAEFSLVEAIAERVVQLLDARDRPVSRRLVSAAELALELGVSRSTVYEHASELGAVRLGEGSKPRLRFDPERAQAGLACLAGKRSQDVSASDDGPSTSDRGRGRRRLPSHLPKPGSVLAVRDREEAA